MTARGAPALEKDKDAAGCSQSQGAQAQITQVRYGCGQIERGQGQTHNDVKDQAADQDAFMDHHRGGGLIHGDPVGPQPGGLEGLAPQGGGGGELIQGLAPQAQPEEAVQGGLLGQVDEDVLPGDGLQQVHQAIRQQQHRPVPAHLAQMVPKIVPTHLVENPHEKDDGNSQENQVETTQKLSFQIVFLVETHIKFSH